MNFIKFFLLFNTILSISQIENYQEVNFLSGTTQFQYKFTEPHLIEEKGIYFFFKFSDDFFIDLTITDEDDNEVTIEVSTDSKYLTYKVSNLKSQVYVFSIRNRGWSYEQTMIFIDNSKEIYTNLNNFIGLSFDTNIIYDIPPLPLILNIGTIEEKIIVTIDEGTSSNLELCELNENECDFKGNNSRLLFEKGKKYKIKYNYIKSGNNANPYYYFKNYIKSIYKEIGLGLNNFSYINTKNLYLIVDISREKEFYLYASYNIEFYFSYSFISENEKNLFLEGLDVSISFNSKRTKEFINMEKEKDFIILKFGTNDNYIKGQFLTFNLIINIQYDKIIEVEKGTYGIIVKDSDWYNRKKYFLISSNSNMVKFSSELNDDFTNLIILDDYDEYYKIFFDSSKENTIFNYYSYTQSRYGDDIFPVNINFTTDNNLTNYFNIYGPDSLFMRTSSNLIDFNYNCSYLFGIKDMYYLYNKKYFGNVDFYKYKNELSIFTNITYFLNSYHLYNYLEEYELVNNRLLIVSGFQIFTFLNSYGSLFDLYFQKVKDSDHIKINQKMFQYNNLVKMLNENKTYYLDFEVDHLIKLDKDFLDSDVTFIEPNGTIYRLNKDNKILKNLKVEGIIAYSTKNALVYFYKKMDNATELGMMEFEIFQNGKIMKFNITSKNQIRLKIVRDFGFKGYYPMINKQNMETIAPSDKSITLYTENVYDKLEDEIYEKEGEKYYIYLFDSENNNLPIFNYENYIIDDIEYIDNLITPKNKLNLEIIPANSNGLILLEIFNKPSIIYQFYTCKCKEIKFNVENINGHFPYYQEYPFTKIINETDDIELGVYNYNGMLIHSFESDEEFVFTYNVRNSQNLKGCFFNDNDFSIKAVFAMPNDIIQVKFTQKYLGCLNQYFIIVAIKDDNNNIESFSNPCYLSKLIVQNSTDLIVIKSSYVESNIDLEIFNIDIHNLNANENSELVINIISRNSISYKSYDFYSPLEFKLQSQYFEEFNSVIK